MNKLMLLLNPHLTLLEAMNGLWLGTFVHLQKMKQKSFLLALVIAQNSLVQMVSVPTWKKDVMGEQTVLTSQVYVMLKKKESLLGTIKLEHQIKNKVDKNNHELCFFINFFLE